MTCKLLFSTVVFLLLAFPKLTFGQAPTLGTAGDFVLFTTVGAVTNTGISQLTGNVGTNSGSTTGFGNVNGTMNNGNGASAQAAADLLIAYNQLNATVATFFPAPLLGNGQILVPGVYSIAGASTISLNLILDGQNNPNAVFIFKMQGPLSTSANAKVKLINGAQACNVFWKVEGLVSMASGTKMRGTVIANNAAINMSAGDTLEGRALSTTGAITINNVLAYLPTGCGSVTLTGPAAPALGNTACYGVLSGNGPVTNAGISLISGDVGTNVGLTTGFNALDVTGMIHPIPDGSTAAATTDLLSLNTSLNNLPFEIELLYPAQFGRNLVLTPHTYRMNAAAVLTDTLYLNARGNANAVFVIQINGALSTSTHSKVILINGTQAKNVFWKVNGAVSINDYSVFNGTIVANNGALQINTGATINGRAFTTNGALSTNAIMVNSVNGTATLAITNLNTSYCKNAASVLLTGTPSGSTFTIDGVSATSFNPATLSVGSHTVVMSNANGSGCSGNGSTSKIVTVTANATTPTITATATSFCAGGSSTLTAASSAGSTFAWFLNGTAIAGATNTTYTANAAGNYTVTASANGCGSAASTATTITVNASPATPTISAAGTTTFCTGGSVALTGASTTSGATYAWFKNGTAITGANTAAYSATTAGSYTVVASANGCGSTASTATAVTVNAPAATPTITAGGATTFCTGGSVILTAASSTTGATYQWFQNGTAIATATSATFTANAAGSYTVVATANACASIASTATAVTVNATPATPTITKNGTTLTSSAATGNQWYLNGAIITGATNQTYLTTANGNYTVKATTNGCTSATSAVMNVTISGIADKLAGMSVQVYPNPANGSFNVKLNGYQKDATVVLYNLVGQSIITDNVPANGNAKNIKIKGLAAGTYLLRVTSNNGTQVSKLIVQ